MILATGSATGISIRVRCDQHTDVPAVSLSKYPSLYSRCSPETSLSQKDHLVFFCPLKKASLLPVSWTPPPNSLLLAHYPRRTISSAILNWSDIWRDFRHWNFRKYDFYFAVLKSKDLGNIANTRVVQKEDKVWILVEFISILLWY